MVFCKRCNYSIMRWLCGLIKPMPIWGMPCYGKIKSLYWMNCSRFVDMKISLSMWHRCTNLSRSVFKHFPHHWPLCGEFTGPGEFPAQRASNAENVSIWWRHHGQPAFIAARPAIAWNDKQTTAWLLLEWRIFTVNHRNIHSHRETAAGPLSIGTGPGSIRLVAIRQSILGPTTDKWNAIHLSCPPPI